MSYWFMWLLVKMTAINGACVTIASVSGLLLVLGFVFRAFAMFESTLFDSTGHTAHALKKEGRKLLIVFIVFGILAVAVPTTPELAAIVVVPQVLENKDVQETLKNFPELSRLVTEWGKETLQKQLEVHVESTAPQKGEK